MTNKIQKAIIAGIIGTAAMTLFMMIAPIMGMPKMNAAQMLSMMLGIPIVAGWIIHFMIGIIFATSYAFLFMGVLKKIGNTILKGTVFGIIVFIFAQIMLAIMGTLMGDMPPMEGSMMLMMIGSLVGHIVFGIAVAFFVKDNS